MAVVSTQQSVAALYAAIFNRAPDQDGLNFWTAKINDGNSFANIATGFAQHEVFTTGIGALPNADYVDALYHNILGAAGDADGVAYWTARLDGGESKASVVASFVEGSLTIDLDAMLADGSLSQADYDLALVRQQTLTNKADVGIYYAETLGAASNLNTGTDSTSKIALEADPQYKASQAAIANVDSTPASVNSAKEAITVAAPTDPSTDPSQAPLTTFTLNKGVAAQQAGELPAHYKLSDAHVDLGAHTVAEVAPATAAAQTVVNGASNAAGLTLTATYTLNDTLVNIANPANAATVTGHAYSLTDATVDLGALTVAGVADAQAAAQAVVDGASNKADLTLAATYTLADTLANIQAADPAVLTGHSYALTDTTVDLGALALADVATADDAAQAIIDGASNKVADSLTLAATYTLADTLANIQAADPAVLTGHSYALTDAVGPLTDLSVAAAGFVADATNAGSYTYSLNDSLANVVGADSTLVSGHDVTLSDSSIDSTNLVSVLSKTTGLVDASAATNLTVDFSAVTTNVNFKAGSGDDVITVGSGVNTITAGAGADKINLGAGADKVVIGNTDSGITLATADTITGFTVGTDTLALGVAATDTNTSINATPEVDFTAALAAANAAFAGDTANALEYYVANDASNTYVFVDNGATHAVADQVVVLTGVQTLTTSDIIAA